MRHLGALITATVVLAFTPLAEAQVPMGRFFTDLIGSGAHTDSRKRVDSTDFLLTAGRTSAELNQALVMQLSLFPFEAGLDVPAPGAERLPASLGFSPTLATHTTSLGNRKLSFSINYQNTSFGKLGDVGLDSGRLGFVFRTPSSFGTQFGTEVLQEKLSLRLQRDTATLAIVYGLSNRIDLGVAIPVVHVQAEGQVLAQVYRAGGTTPDRHFFDVYPGVPVAERGCETSKVDVPIVARPGAPVDPATQTGAPFDMVELASRTVYSRCTANGFGDVLVHGRFRLGAARPSGVALSLGLRLPTGNADELLGAGGTRVTAGVIWNLWNGRRFAPHGTVAYTASLGNASAQLNDTTVSGIAPNNVGLKLPNEISYSVGADVRLFDRFTTALNLFGRYLSSVPRFRVADAASVMGPGDPALSGPILVNDGKGVHVLVGNASGQVALTDRVLLRGNILFPILGSGLMPGVGVGVGLGYRF